MNKKYFLMIIIIALLCLTSLFLILEFTDITSSKSMNIGSYSCSIPNNFKVMSSKDNSVVIHNPTSGLSISIHSHEKNKSYNFSKSFNQIKNNSKNKILSNGTININGIKVDSVYYSHKNNNSLNNRSLFYFKVNKVPFTVNMENFNYKTDYNQTIDNLSFIITSLEKNNKT